MKRFFQLSVFLFLIFLTYHGTCSVSDLETIRQRIINELLQSEVNDSRVERLVNTINDDGSWPGINYEDLSRTGFEHSRHLYNMVLMSRAYKSKDSRFYKNEAVKSTIESALGFWVKHDFICDNWWHNQIGTPGDLVEVMLLVGDELPQKLVNKTQPIIGRATLKREEGVFYGARPGGDRIKIAGIVAKNMLFKRNGERFDEVIRIIEGEIKFSTGKKGMQHDYSFHHRDDGVNNTLSYGRGYAHAFAEWAAYVAGTKYTFSEEKLQHLIDYYLDGICKMTVHGKYPDPGAKNRSISRRGTLHAMGTEIPEKLLKTSDYRNSELKEIVGIRKGKTKPALSHSTLFWHSDYYSHQRPDWFASVRMFSSRNHNMEMPYNSEGLKNHHLGDGSNFISLSGREYYNIFPVFDWQKIPGTTVMQKTKLPAPEEIQKPGLTDFVGAVTNGQTGAVAFDFESPHDPLKAKKSWFFFKDAYVCLGSGIKCRENKPVATTVNQCLLKDDVTVKTGNKQSKLEAGNHKFNNAKWIFHNGVGYLFPEQTQVNCSNQSQRGSWYEISKQYSTPENKISKEVFKLWIDHGKGPERDKYQYIVVPATTARELEKRMKNRKIEVVVNTSAQQAVKNEALGVYQGVFHQSGEIRFTRDLLVQNHDSGIVMLKTEEGTISEISVADPSQKLNEIHLSVSSHIDNDMDQCRTVWNEDKQMTDITVELPQGVYAGKSVIIELQ